MDHVRITDVAPRDGLQNEAAIVPVADKVRLIRALLACGVDEVEATSFVSPRWIPQLGDAEEVLGALCGEEGIEASRHRGNEPIRPVISALVPNERGFERALVFHERLREVGYPGGLKIAVFTAASETFSKKNTNASIAETIERFGAFLPRAIQAGMAVRLYISCVVACPFEGPIAPGAVRAVADDLLALAPKGELDLGDTIGAATVRDLDALLDAFTDAERGAMTLHLHDTFGRASACVARALERGVRSFDGAAGGLGGCPYAGTPERRAPGNIATETLVHAIREAGYRTRVDEHALAKAGALARALTARPGGGAG